MNKICSDDIVMLNLDIKTLEHIEALREIKKQLRKKGPTLISITSTIDHSSVSAAAEIGVDGFLIKPFNASMFHGVIDNIKEFSFSLNEYFKMIEKGKYHLFKKSDYHTAHTIFSKALELNTAPTLAYYYLGRTCEFLGKDVSAINHYRRGLKLNKWHIKSLMALYRAYIKHSDMEEAYELLKHISSTFPESPQRFCELVELSVKNYRFHEVPDLCKIYENIKFSNSKMSKYFFSSLYISAKYFLSKGKTTEASTIATALINLSNKDFYYYNLLKKAYQEYETLDTFNDRFSDINLRASA